MSDVWVTRGRVYIDGKRLPAVIDVSVSSDHQGDEVTVTFRPDSLLMGDAAQAAIEGDMHTPLVRPRAKSPAAGSITQASNPPKRSSLTKPNGDPYGEMGSQ